LYRRGNQKGGEKKESKKPTATIDASCHVTVSDGFIGTENQPTKKLEGLL